MSLAKQECVTFDLTAYASQFRPALKLEAFIRLVNNLVLEQGCSLNGFWVPPNSVLFRHGDAYYLFDNMLGESHHAVFRLSCMFQPNGDAEPCLRIARTNSSEAQEKLASLEFFSGRLPVASIENVAQLSEAAPIFALLDIEPLAVTGEKGMTIDLSQ